MKRNSFIVVFGLLFSLGCSDELPAPAPDPSVGSTNNDNGDNSHEGHDDGDCRRDTDCGSGEICDDGQCVSDSGNHNVGNNDNNGSDDDSVDYTEHNPPVPRCNRHSLGVAIHFIGRVDRQVDVGMTTLSGEPAKKTVTLSRHGAEVSRFDRVESGGTYSSISDDTATGFWFTPNGSSWDWWYGLSRAERLAECRRMVEAESVCSGTLVIQLAPVSGLGCEASWDEQ